MKHSHKSLAGLLCTLCCLVLYSNTYGNNLGGIPTRFVAIAAASAQSDTALSNDTLDVWDRMFFTEPITITAGRNNQDMFSIPYLVELTRATDFITSHATPTMAQALKRSPGVSIQKTSRGQGSPFVRGFTGFRTLYLVDGIRVNNAVFREGPNQYANTIDPFCLQRIETVKGPASVIYGSDAVGGAVGAVTRGGRVQSERFAWTRRFHYRFASAERANTGRLEFSAGRGRHLALLIGATLKDFGDLTDGRGRQPMTGYDEWSADGRLDYYPTAHSRLTLVHQRLEQDDIHRVHKTVHALSWNGTSIGSDRDRAYDQTRHLTYLQYRAYPQNGGLDLLTASLSWHHQEESLHRVRSSGDFEDQGFDVGTIGATFQAGYPTELGRFTLGAEFYRDNVDSYRKRYNADGSLDRIEIQGPVADDAAYDILGVYIQDDLSITERLAVIAGLRFSRYAVDAGRVRDPQTGDPFSLKNDWQNVVGGLRVQYSVSRDRAQLFAGVSQAFRAPNLSDLTRFDAARTDEFEIAAPDLDPEKFLSVELGLKARSERGNGQVSVYFTDIRDMIVRTPTGNVIDDDSEVTKRNSASGFAAGVEFSGEYRLSPSLAVEATAATMDGEVDAFPAADQPAVREPLDRLTPAAVRMTVRWEPASERWLALDLTSTAAQSNLSSRDQADNQRIPPGGTPGWTVLTIRGGIRIHDGLTATAAVENVTDETYRIHGSGLNEPGVNLVLSLDWSF